MIRFMKDNLFVVLLLVFALGAKATILISYSELTLAKEAKEKILQCEKDLPRSQHCEVEIRAVVRDSP